MKKITTFLNWYAEVFFMVAAVVGWAVLLLWLTTIKECQ